MGPRPPRSPTSLFTTITSLPSSFKALLTLITVSLINYMADRNTQSSRLVQKKVGTTAAIAISLFTTTITLPSSCRALPTMSLINCRADWNTHTAAGLARGKPGPHSSYCHRRCPAYLKEIRMCLHDHLVELLAQKLDSDVSNSY